MLPAEPVIYVGNDRQGNDCADTEGCADETEDGAGWIAKVCVLAVSLGAMESLVVDHTVEPWLDGLEAIQNRSIVSRSHLAA